MRSLIVALSLSLPTPCSLALAGDAHFNLILPLQRPAPGYAVSWSWTPYLTLTPGDSNPTLSNAFTAVTRAEPAPTVDDVDIVLSALDAVNHDPSIQTELERQMGFNQAEVEKWTAQNLPRARLRAKTRQIEDAEDRSARLAVRWSDQGLGAGGLLGAKLVDSQKSGAGLLLGGVATAAVPPGESELNSFPALGAVEQKMLPLLLALLGRENARPGQAINWARPTYRPVEELIKRLRHATLVNGAVGRLLEIHPPPSPKERTRLIHCARNILASDIAVGGMLLAVLSRQMDEGRHIDLLTNLIAVLPVDQLTPLAQMASWTSLNADALLGISGAASPELRADRAREVLHTAAWVRAALLTRATATNGPDAVDLGRMTEDLLDEDAYFKGFDAARADARLIDARRGLTDFANPNEARLRTRLEMYLNSSTSIK